MSQGEMNTKNNSGVGFKRPLTKARAGGLLREPSATAQRGSLSPCPAGAVAFADPPPFPCYFTPTANTWGKPHLQQLLELSVD